MWGKRTFLDRIPALAAGPTYGPEADYWYGPHQPQGSGAPVSPEQAMRLSAVQCAVRLISGTEAKLPFPVYKRLKDKGREQARQHPLWDILNNQPNEWQTSFEFRRMLTAHVALTGNGYAQIVPGRRGFADTLIPWNPHCVRPEQLVDGRIVYHVMQRDGTRKTYQRDEVLHLRDLTLDGIKGLSRIEQAALSIGMTVAATTHSASGFHNSSRPGGVLSTDKKLTDKERQDNLKSWDETFGGPFNTGKTALLDQGAKFQAVSITNEQAQLLELLNFGVEDIARLYGIPPHLIGLTEKQTSWGTGVEQMSIGFLSFHMLDWFVMWETAVDRDLLLVPDLYFAEHNVDGLLRADYKTRMDGNRVAIESGQATPNEVRRRDNMNPREDGNGDRFWMPANFRYADEPMPTPGTSTGFDAAEDDDPPAEKPNGQAGHIAPAEVLA